MLTSNKIGACTAKPHTAAPPPVASRRGLLLQTAFLVAVPAQAAMARDAEKAQADKEARRQKLREVAEETKKTGKDSQVFKSPDASLPEEASDPSYRFNRLASN